MIKSILIFVLVLMVNLSFGQGQKFSTENKKAISHFQKGYDYYDAKHLNDAKDELEEAIKIDPNFLEARSVLGDLYMDMNKMDKAMEQYKAAIAVNPDFFPQNYYNLGRTEMAMEKFEDARVNFIKALGYKNAIHPNTVKKIDKLLSNANFAVEAIKHPLPFKPINMGDSINTENAEYWPAITADEKTFYFTILHPNDNYRPGTFGSPKFQEDIFSSSRTQDKWSKATDVSKIINTFDNEGAICISADGHTLFYTVCNRAGDYGSCDIYIVEKYGDVWGNPHNIGAPINTDKFESQPSISSDGLTLYFVSSRKGGLGKSDIWKSTKQPDGKWGEPVNLGPKINTPESEQSPFIHSDNRTLYFTSDGLPGMGLEDLFLSRLDNEGNWSNPQNLGYPINSTSTERGLIVNAAGNKAFFASERISGRGQLDIFYFDLPQEIKPLRVSYVKGKVKDHETGKPLETKFELVDLKTSKVVGEAYSDKVSGDFLFCLPTDKDYALSVSKPGYLFYSENFSLKGNTNVKDAVNMDVSLKQIKIGSGVVLKNIFFNTASFELKEESKVELERLIFFLNQNPKVRIELGGHTDNVGDDKSNQVLSQNRAKAVLDYLLKAGIVKERLSHKGYGESKPVATNATDEGRAMNRRTEFVVTGM